MFFTSSVFRNHKLPLALSLFLLLSLLAILIPSAIYLHRHRIQLSALQTTISRTRSNVEIIRKKLRKDFASSPSSSTTRSTHSVLDMFEPTCEPYGNEAQKAEYHRAIRDLARRRAASGTGSTNDDDNIETFQCAGRPYVVPSDPEIVLAELRAWGYPPDELPIADLDEPWLEQGLKKFVFFQKRLNLNGAIFPKSEIEVIGLDELKHHLAVIVLFRERQQQQNKSISWIDSNENGSFRCCHLRLLVGFLKHFFQRREGHWRLFLIEMDPTDPRPFNKGAMMNAAVRGLVPSHFDHLVMQDVDHFPEDPGNAFSFPSDYAPVHRCWSSSIEYSNYPALVGGILQVSRKVFEDGLNGFSNAFWGWGAEDDDLYFRMVTRTSPVPEKRTHHAPVPPPVLRIPHHLGRAFALAHPVNTPRRVATKKSLEGAYYVRTVPRVFGKKSKDGMDTVEFSVVGEEHSETFSRFTVLLDEGMDTKNEKWKRLSRLGKV